MKPELVNPLLNYDEFAPYQSIKAEHVVPAVEEITNWARK